MFIDAVARNASREMCCRGRLVHSVEPHTPVDRIAISTARKTVESPIVNVEAAGRIRVERACPSQPILCRLQFNRFRYQLRRGALRSGQCAEVWKVRHDGMIVDHRPSSRSRYVDDLAPALNKCPKPPDSSPIKAWLNPTIRLCQCRVNQPRFLLKGLPPGAWPLWRRQPNARQSA